MTFLHKFGALLITSLLVTACATVPADMDAAALHDRTLTLDTHIDIPLTYMKSVNPGGPTELQVDLPKLRQGQLDSGFWIVYTPQGELTYSGIKAAQEISETRLKAICDMTKAFPSVGLAKTAADVRQIVSEGRYAVLIGMENAYPLGRTGFAEELKIYTGVGVRYVGLTHFGHNQFGDSSNPHPVRDGGRPKWNGLSPAGYELITALNEAGVMVDVSHAAKSTMMQAAEASSTPIIASHSGVKAVADTARNLDDEQLRKIAEVNGVAQMVALGAYVKAPTGEQKTAREALDAEFGTNRALWGTAKTERYTARRAEITAMAPEATVADFVDHIDHAVAVAGVDHVGIASDFDGGGGIDGWKDASETQNVTAELVKRGYSEADIGKIWGGNLLRVMEAVEAKATTLG